ncbi:hypothetical protein AUJ14_06090 [Candidatus Micrarchaeota archaeon CG1_02_55_22]|nr:MAG: hypothetical protein AUJ14_06090 [Candidatus Micrarchaeota archaeon CG1_02_55_22]
MAFIALFVSDAHAEPCALDALKKLVAVHEPRLVVIAGDLTMNGPLAYAQKLINAASSKGARVLFEWGNMDDAPIVDWMKTQQDCIHARRVEVEGHAVVGLGGSVTSPFNTPTEYSEEEYARLLNDLLDENTVFAPHNPPYGTIADVIRAGTHVGSRAILDAIKQAQPRLCVCGHIHEAEGAERVGRTLLLKTGPLMDGKAVLVDLESLKYEFVEA